MGFKINPPLFASLLLISVLFISVTISGQGTSFSFGHYAEDIAGGTFGKNISSSEDYSFTGKVGIGTTSPSAKLTVTDGSANFLFGDSANAGFELRHDGGGTPYIDFSNDGSVDYDARIRLTGDDYLAIEGAKLGLEVTGGLKVGNQIITSPDGMELGIGPKGWINEVRLTLSDWGPRLRMQTINDNYNPMIEFYDSADTQVGYMVYHIADDRFYFNGNVFVNGNFGASGTKSAVVLTSQGPIEMYAIEAPESRFEDFGSGKLVNGKARVKLDPIFMETISDEEDYLVFLTLESECNGIYVSKKTPDYFEVRELNGGKSNAKFNWRIVGKRADLKT